MTLRTILAATLITTLTTPLFAQIDRESTVPVDYQHFRQLTPAELQPLIAQGYRLSNIEWVNNYPDPQFDGTLVRNTGVYQRQWSAHFDKTQAQLSQIMSQSSSRIVDLERYEVAGEERFAAIMFANTGSQQKSWSWFSGVVQGSVLTTANSVDGRIIDLEPYFENGVQQYHLITIRNTGADYKPWWVYTDISVQGIQDHIAQHGSRVYDFESQGVYSTGHACVLVRDGLPSNTQFNVWYANSYTTDDELGGRIIGLAKYGFGYRAITLLDNFNAFATYGFGSFGTQGYTAQSATGTGLTGRQVRYDVQHLRPFAPTVLHLGLGRTDISLAGFGGTGCKMLTYPILSVPMYANGSGNASLPLTVPEVPALHGIKFQTQMIAIDPGANALSIQTSNGIETTLRSW